MARKALLVIDGDLKKEGDPREIKQVYKDLASQENSKFDRIEYWVSSQGLVNWTKGTKSVEKKPVTKKTAKSKQ
tara:strand:- start:1034 stop:1255 length:222 start_codon:yes stop_codon:yes gene_type:complete